MNLEDQAIADRYRADESQQLGLQVGPDFFTATLLSFKSGTFNAETFKKNDGNKRLSRCALVLEPGVKLRSDVGPAPKRVADGIKRMMGAKWPRNGAMSVGEFRVWLRMHRVRADGVAPVSVGHCAFNARVIRSVLRVFNKDGERLRFGLINQPNGDPCLAIEQAGTDARAWVMSLDPRSYFFGDLPEAPVKWGERNEG